MNKISLSFYVYFDELFWVGVFEQINNESLQVCKIVFGQEPQTQEILQFIANQFTQLKWSPCVDAESKTVKMNPKRKQRIAKQVMLTNGIGTKSQQALKMQYESMKHIQKENKKMRNLQKKQYCFELQQHKKKEKHKGH